MVANVERAGKGSHEEVRRHTEAKKDETEQGEPNDKGRTMLQPSFSGPEKVTCALLWLHF